MQVAPLVFGTTVPVAVSILSTTVNTPIARCFDPGEVRLAVGGRPGLRDRAGDGRDLQAGVRLVVVGLHVRLHLRGEHLRRGGGAGNGAEGEGGDESRGSLQHEIFLPVLMSVQLWAVVVHVSELLTSCSTALIV